MGGLLLSQAVFTHKHHPINQAGTERTHLHTKDFFFPPPVPLIFKGKKGKLPRRGMQGKTLQSSRKTRAPRRAGDPPHPPTPLGKCGVLPWLSRRHPSSRRRRSAWKALIPQGGLGAGVGAPLPLPAGASGRRPPAPLPRLHRRPPSSSPGSAAFTGGASAAQPGFWSGEGEGEGGMEAKCRGKGE